MVPDACGRRRVIAAGLVGTLPLSAGCSALTDAGSASELGQITVENGDDAPHRIHVVVERDSELVYGSAHELEAVSEPEGDDDHGSIDTAILENADWDGTTGDWSIYTRVDDRTSWSHHSVPNDDGATCHSVRLKIETDSSVTSFTPECDSWPPDGDG